MHENNDNSFIVIIYMNENGWLLFSWFYLRHVLSYQSTFLLYPCVDVQLFREWTGHSASGEGVPNAAAPQHHQTQGGAVSRVRRLAGMVVCIPTVQLFSSVNWVFGGVAGGHAVGDQPTGAAERGGEEEGKPAGEGGGGGTSEEQVPAGEGRDRERILLLFQRQVTKTSSSSPNRQYQPWTRAGLRPANDVYSLRCEILIYILYVNLPVPVIKFWTFLPHQFTFSCEVSAVWFKKKPPKLELQELIFLLKFQKTVILFSRPLWWHQIMEYLMTQMQTSQIIYDVSRSSMDGAGHYLHLFSYSRVALASLSWSCQGSTNLSSSIKQLFVHM